MPTWKKKIFDKLRANRTVRTIALPAANENDTERPPPPPPTPLEFPVWDPSTYTEPLKELSIEKVCRLLLSIKKPGDIFPEHLRALNLKVSRDVGVSGIFPGGDRSYLPPLDWWTSDTGNGASVIEMDKAMDQKLLSNGSPAPRKERYDLVKRELLFSNDDALREVLRQPPLPGHQKIKLTHSRKFWMGLERMSRYWDCTLDKYMEKASTKPPETAPPSHSQSHGNENKNGTTSNGHMEVDSTGTETEKTYKGRRIGTGRDMPEEIRDDTLRGFVEMVAWAFGCQVIIPSVAPRLRVHNILFPVRHSLTVARSPRDRQVARKGIVEGPLLAIQCRNETQFRFESEDVGEGQGDLIDLFREVGAMLLLAQERAREGTVETRPGEGKWWATEPRWGGAAVLETQTEKANGREKAGAVEESANKKFKSGPTLLAKSLGIAPPRRLSVTDRWKIVQPGPSTWDKKVNYMRIGKDKDTEFDDVSFLLAEKLLR